MQDQVLKKLKELTKHEHVKLTNNGNQALFFAMYIAKQQGKTKILIPDQGGWLSYQTYPKELGMKIVEYETDDGIIKLDQLKLDKNCTLILTNFAGYFAEQPLKEVYERCKRDGALMILDATAIGDKTCDGNYADIITTSFGKDKLINLGYGGMISTNDKELFNTKIFSIIEFYDVHDQLLEKLNSLDKRLDSLFELNQKIKIDLKDYDIVHRESRGINVILRYKSQKQKQEIIDYCEKNDLEFTQCPRYIRIEDEAISIEVKRR